MLPEDRLQQILEQFKTQGHNITKWTTLDTLITDLQTIMHDTAVLRTEYVHYVEQQKHTVAGLHDQIKQLQHALADAAQEIPCAGTVAHRIQKLKQELSAYITDLTTQLQTYRDWSDAVKSVYHSLVVHVPINTLTTIQLQSVEHALTVLETTLPHYKLPPDTVTRLVTHKTGRKA